MNHTVLIRNAAILLFCLTRAIYSIKCYKCSPVSKTTYRNNETPRLCSQFDYSDKYIVDCPFSTLCMKKYYSVNLTGKSTNGTERGCASQKYEYQQHINGHWEMAYTIQEDPYQEGCFMSDDMGIKITSTMFCYCRGNLCNGANNVAKIKLSKITVILFILYVLL